jgi:hypothetical protein
LPRYIRYPSSAGINPRGIAITNQKSAGIVVDFITIASTTKIAIITAPGNKCSKTALDKGNWSDSNVISSSPNFDLICRATS